MNTMNPGHLQLSNAIEAAMLEQARRSPEREICGLLGGRDYAAGHYYPINNIAEDPVHEYFMDPQQQIDAMRHMREQGENLLGIFHSHPDSPAKPSETDLARASYPDTIYIIAGPVDKGIELNAFFYDGKAFYPVDIQITNN